MPLTVRASAWPVRLCGEISGNDIRHGEGARSGRGPVAKLLVREAARTTARLYRTFRYDIVRLQGRKHPRIKVRFEAGAASTHACMHYPRGAGRRE